MKTTVMHKIGIGFIWLYLIFVILFSAFFILSEPDEPRDFGSFVLAGLNAAAGKNPYDNEGDLVFRVVIKALSLDIASPNLNPPISVVFFEAIAKLGTPEFLSKSWRLTSIGIYIATILFLEKVYPEPKGKVPTRLIWALSLAGFWHTIEVGQIYIPLVLLFTIAWKFIEIRKYIQAGVLLGLVLAIKPNFMILILALAAGRYFLLVIASLATFAVISFLPLLKYGPDIYSQWMTATSSYDGYALPNNSFVGLMVRFQHPEWGNILSIVLVGAILLLIWRKPVDIKILAGLGVTASLLCSPVAWDGYTLFLLPYLYSQTKWDWTEKIGAAIFTLVFIIPYFLFYLSFLNFVIFGWTYGWGIILILFSQFKKAITITPNTFATD